MKYFVLALLLAVLGLLVTTFEPRPTPSYPLVRVRTDDGFFLTLVQSRVHDQARCREAVDAFVATLAKACPSCTVESEECTLELQGIDKALAEGAPLPLYRVSAKELKIALIGPPAKVRARCERIAEGIVAQGMKTAACVYPEPG